MTGKARRFQNIHDRIPIDIGLTTTEHAPRQGAHPHRPATLGLSFIQRYRFLTTDQFARAAALNRSTASDQLRFLERQWGRKCWWWKSGPPLKAVAAS